MMDACIDTSADRQPHLKKGQLEGETNTRKANKSNQQVKSGQVCIVAPVNDAQDWRWYKYKRV